MKLDFDGLSVIWIHGANQYGLSLQYLRSLTRFKKELVVEYDTLVKFHNNLETRLGQISSYLIYQLIK